MSDVDKDSAAYKAGYVLGVSLLIVAVLLTLYVAHLLVLLLVAGAVR